MSIARSLPSWSNQLAVYLGTVGAAVGLGSIWRFPYLAGTYGGGTFIAVFVLACLFVATPLLVAEFMIGRYARVSPASAAGAMAVSIGASPRWNVIGTVGTVAAFLIGSYYTIIAGWIIAYAWKCATGSLAGLGRPALQAVWADFLADPWALMGWQVLFLCLVAFISARGLGRGIEVASRVRAPLLLALLLLLDAYSLLTGDVPATLSFAFAPHLGALSGELVLAAIGQAFYATGVGIAIMLAYGSYMQRDAPLAKPALIITGAILCVSLLATLMVFPLVFRFHMNPAAGPALVFDVLPTAFAAMPAGRLVGTVFFVLLILAALTPSLAVFEPVVAWFESRGTARAPAALFTVAVLWLAGIVSVLSFNTLKDWHPLASIPVFAGKTAFESIDFIASNLLLPGGALLSCLFTGWRLDRVRFDAEFGPGQRRVAHLCRLLLRYVCPVSILAVLVITFVSAPH